MNGLNRVQMADQPAQVNDHIVLSEQGGGVSSAGQDLLSACWQSASSLNGVLVLTRQTWHLILRENKLVCDLVKTNQLENRAQTIKRLYIFQTAYIPSQIHQCSFVWLRLYFSLHSFFSRQESEREEILQQTITFKCFVFSCILVCWHISRRAMKALNILYVAVISIVQKWFCS